mgnify:CR=1 FL=1
MNKVLGKIKSCELAIRDGVIGFVFELSINGGSSGVTDAKNMWQTIKEVKHRNEATHDRYKWTVEDRNNYLISSVDHINHLMNDANVYKFSDLKDKPIEVTLDGFSLVSFRILTEVL